MLDWERKTQQIQEDRKKGELQESGVAAAGTNRNLAGVLGVSLTLTVNFWSLFFMALKSTTAC